MCWQAWRRDGATAWREIQSGLVALHGIRHPSLERARESGSVDSPSLRVTCGQATLREKSRPWKACPSTAAG